jgi:ABC-type dipeptide/oligopeptide/nickel transport system permease component
VDAGTGALSGAGAAAGRAGELGGFALRRILSAIPTVFMVLLLGFLATRLAPGDPVLLIAGEHAPPEMLDELRARFGLDRPLPQQFLIYLKEVLSGDFGFSYAQQQPVVSLIAERVPATLLLVLSAVVIALVFGVVLAVLAIAFQNRVPDTLLSAISMIGYSVPVFWLAQLLIFFLAVKLDLFPTGGMYNFRAPSDGIGRLLDLLHHLALPALNLGLIYTAMIARLTRAEMAEVMTQDHVLTARSKGLSGRAVLLRHVLRNALGPLLTMTGVLLGTLFAGAIFTETVFSWPGLGRLLYDALFARDYPIIVAMFILTSLALVVTNAVVDILYSVVDPRIRVR